MKNKIFIKDWLKLKPYERETAVDLYYLKTSNKVYSALTKHKYSFVLSNYFDTEGFKELSCFLTAYFEDVISECNIWHTFTKLHKRMYKKAIPYYVLREYYEDEVNEQDVRFLIWYFINTIQEDKYVGPLNEFIKELAKDVISIFDNEWEFAPENERLKSYYTIGEDYMEFYEPRELIGVVLFETYLFYPDTGKKLENTLDEFVSYAIEKNSSEKDLTGLLLEEKDYTMIQSYTKLLSLRGSEWTAEILGEDHPLHHAYLNMSPKIRQRFFYKGQDETHVTLEHIATGKQFKPLKKSFETTSNFDKIDDILFLGLVKWKDEWWLSGTSFGVEYSEKLVTEERNSGESRMAINVLEEESKEVQKSLDEQYKLFLEFNNGSPIAFMPSEKVSEFNQRFFEYVSASKNSDNKKKQKAIENAKKKGYTKALSNFDYQFTDDEETSVVFFNPKLNIEIGTGIISAFPAPDNPFFNMEESHDHILDLFLEPEFSPELALYCVKHYKDKLPYFKTKIGKAYLRHLDFSLRFWKGKNYHTKPAIVLI